MRKIIALLIILMLTASVSVALLNPKMHKTFEIQRLIIQKGANN